MIWQEAKRAAFKVLTVWMFTMLFIAFVLAVSKFNAREPEPSGMDLCIVIRAGMCR